MTTVSGTRPELAMIVFAAFVKSLIGSLVGASHNVVGDDRRDRAVTERLGRAVVEQIADAPVNSKSLVIFSMRLVIAPTSSMRSCATISASRSVGVRRE